MVRFTTIVRRLKRYSQFFKRVDFTCLGFNNRSITELYVTFIYLFICSIYVITDIDLNTYVGAHCQRRYMFLPWIISKTV